jgi:hypothetical protein
MGACFSDSSMSPEQARALAEEQQKSKALEASLASVRFLIYSQQTSLSFFPPFVLCIYNT